MSNKKDGSITNESNDKDWNEIIQYSLWNQVQNSAGKEKNFSRKKLMQLEKRFWSKKYTWTLTMIDIAYSSQRPFN